MAIPGDEHRALAFGEGEQIVVAGIRGATRCDCGLWCDVGSAPEQRDEFVRFGQRDPRTKLRVGQRPLELGEQLLGNNQLKLAVEPA